MAPSSASRLRPALGDHPGGSIFSIAVTCPALGDHPGGSVLGIAVIRPALGDHSGGSVFGIAVTPRSRGPTWWLHLPPAEESAPREICPLQETTPVAPSSASRSFALL